MLIKALHTFPGTLDLSAMERLQEGNPCELYPFRLYMKPGDKVEVDDKFYNLIRIQSALKLGYIEIGNMSAFPELNNSMVDPSYNGVTMTQIAGENLTFGQIVYYNSDGKVYKSKADVTNYVICMGIATENALAGKPVRLLIDGLIRSSAVFNFTTGGQASQNAAIVYVSDTVAGAVTQTRTVVSTHIVQIIGYALTPDVLSFKPDYTYIELA